MIDHEMYELDFPKENSKTVQNKKDAENISKTKMKIYSVFMLYTRFMMRVYKKERGFSGKQTKARNSF